MALLVITLGIEWPCSVIPSTPRITVWRRLRRLGAARLVDGLVALPADARTKEQFEWLAGEVVEAGGEATVWMGRPGSRADERRLAARMATEVAEEYRTIAREAAELSRSRPVDRRSLARLQRELQRIGVATSSRHPSATPPTERCATSRLPEPAR